MTRNHRHHSLLAALTAVGLAVGTLGTASVADESQRIAIELRDGSRLVGTTSTREIQLVTTDGKPATLELSQLVDLEVGEDREIAAVCVYKEPAIRGAIETPTLDVSTLVGDLNVPLEHVVRIQPLNPRLGLIAHYPLDEDARDLSGLGNHGVAHGGFSFARGRVGKAATFDGDDDYIEIDPESNVTKIEEFTVSAWVFVASWKPPIPGSGLDRQYVFDGHSNATTDAWEDRSGFLLCLDGVTGAEYVANFTWFDAANWLETRDAADLSGRWRLVSFVRRRAADGKLVERSYVDGAATATCEFNSRGDWRKPLDMQHAWYIGTHAGNNPTHPPAPGCGYGFRGLIDDVRIYDRALSDAELRALFEEGDSS